MAGRVVLLVGLAVGCGKQPAKVYDDASPQRLDVERRHRDVQAATDAVKALDASGYAGVELAALADLERRRFGNYLPETASSCASWELLGLVERQVLPAAMREAALRHVHAQLASSTGAELARGHALGSDTIKEQALEDLPHFTCVQAELAGKALAAETREILQKALRGFEQAPAGAEGLSPTAEAATQLYLHVLVSTKLDRTIAAVAPQLAEVLRLEAAKAHPYTVRCTLQFVAAAPVTEPYVLRDPPPGNLLGKQVEWIAEQARHLERLAPRVPPPVPAATTYAKLPKGARPPSPICLGMINYADATEPMAAFGGTQIGRSAMVSVLLANLGSRKIMAIDVATEVERVEQHAIALVPFEAATFDQLAVRITVPHPVKEDVSPRDKQLPPVIASGLEVTCGPAPARVFVANDELYNCP